MADDGAEEPPISAQGGLGDTAGRPGLAGASSAEPRRKRSLPQNRRLPAEPPGCGLEPRTWPPSWAEPRAAKLSARRCEPAPRPWQSRKRLGGVLRCGWGPGTAARARPPAGWAGLRAALLALRPGQKRKYPPTHTPPRQVGPGNSSLPSIWGPMLMKLVINSSLCCRFLHCMCNQMWPSLGFPAISELRRARAAEAPDAGSGSRLCPRRCPGPAGRSPPARTPAAASPSREARLSGPGLGEGEYAPRPHRAQHLARPRSSPEGGTGQRPGQCVPGSAGYRDTAGARVTATTPGTRAIP